MLVNVGFELKGIKYDIMLELYVFNSVGSCYDMDLLVLKYLGYKNISFEDIVGKGKK